MPVAVGKVDTQPIPINPVNPVIAEDSFKGVAVDTRITPHSSILSYMEGMPWQIKKWFGQLLGNSSEVRPLDVAGTLVNQQYFSVENLELRVDQALTSTRDSTTGIETVTGSSLLLPFLTPNKYDYFVAEAGAGRTGIYQVIEIERSTFNRSSAFRIEYKLLCFLEEEPLLYQSLLDKTQREYIFHRDRLVQGQQSLLTQKDTNILQGLRRHLDSIQKDYIRSFYRNGINSLIIPGQDNTCYDPFLVRFVLSIFEIDQYSTLYNITQQSYEYDLIASQINIWSVLLERREELLNECITEYGLVDSVLFRGNPRLRQATYTPIEFLVYPKYKDESLLGDEYVLPGTYSQVKQSAVRQGILFDPMTAVVADTNGQNIPVIPVTAISSSYVLPELWYTNRLSSSALEVLLMDYLRHSTINGEMLNGICNTYPKWGRVEQFYYGPLLVLLLKVSIREIK